LILAEIPEKPKPAILDVEKRGENRIKGFENLGMGARNGGMKNVHLHDRRIHPFNP
jgi:hypothetical protein